MLTLDETQTQTKTQTRNGTPNGAASPEPPGAARPAPSVQQPPSPPPVPDPEAHFISPSPRQRGGLLVSPPSPAELPHEARSQITNALLTPDANPHHLAEDFNVPVSTILDIYESEETQSLITRLERMQQRRAEYHINFSKPLAARNLTDILEQSINEEMTCHHRETPEATTLRWRRRETTRRVAMAVLRGWPLATPPSGTPPLRGGRNGTSATNQNIQTPETFEPISQSFPGRSALRADRAAPSNRRGRTNTPTVQAVSPICAKLIGASAPIDSSPQSTSHPPSHVPIPDEQNGSPVTRTAPPQVQSHAPQLPPQPTGLIARAAQSTRSSISPAVRRKVEAILRAHQTNAREMNAEPRAREPEDPAPNNSAQARSPPHT